MPVRSLTTQAPFGFVKNQVPERPAAVGSRCVPPKGVWGVTPDMQLDGVGGCGKKPNFY